LILTESTPLSDYCTPTRLGTATGQCATEGLAESESNLPSASPSRCQSPCVLFPTPVEHTFFRR